jgi:hypothetical protein
MIFKLSGDSLGTLWAEALEKFSGDSLGQRPRESFFAVRSALTVVDATRNVFEK